MAIAVRRHPLCADRMSFSCPSRPLGFGLRIDVQHDPRDFLPIGAFSAGIEQSEVGDYMLLIIAGELGSTGAVSATSGSGGGFCMNLLSGASPNMTVALVDGSHPEGST